VADEMAAGCPSLIEAAYRLKMPVRSVEDAWRGICRDLGRQAR
jgi:hypothetical protein